MFRSQNNVSTAGTEVRSMISEAELMLKEASIATGEKASELQKKGMQMLSSSISKAQELERMAITSAKELATTTDDLVHANPWRSMGAAGLIGAGIGLALGVAIMRK